MFGMVIGRVMRSWDPLDCHPTIGGKVDILIVLVGGGYGVFSSRAKIFFKYADTHLKY